MIPATWVPISPHRMLLAWALAEPHYWGDGSPEELRRKVTEELDLTGSDEADAVRRLLAGRRGPETALLRTLPLRWYEALLPPEELGGVIPHKHWSRRWWETNHPTTTEPHRTVAEFAAHPQMPERDKFSPGWHGATRRAHPPILVATNDDGPWRIAEGNHRVVTHWVGYSRRDADYQAPLGVLVGVHADVDQWPDYEP